MCRPLPNTYLNDWHIRNELLHQMDNGLRNKIMTRSGTSSSKALAERFLGDALKNYDNQCRNEGRLEGLQLATQALDDMCYSPFRKPWNKPMSNDIDAW